MGHLHAAWHGAAAPLQLGRRRGMASGSRHRGTPQHSVRRAERLLRASHRCSSGVREPRQAPAKAAATRARPACRRSLGYWQLCSITEQVPKRRGASVLGFARVWQGAAVQHTLHCKLEAHIAFEADASSALHIHAAQVSVLLDRLRSRAMRRDTTCCSEALNACCWHL